jgi:hypothetical protein
MSTENDRIAAFKEELAQLEAQVPSDSTDRRYLTAGIVLLVAAVVMIVVGWWGASGTAIVSEQMPYVISGGLLAVVLAVAGGALFTRYSMSRYLRFWLIRLVYEQRSQTDRIVDALEALRPADGPAGSAAATPPAPARPVKADPAQQQQK